MTHQEPGRRRQRRELVEHGKRQYMEHAKQITTDGPIGFNFLRLNRAELLCFCPHRTTLARKSRSLYGELASLLRMI